MWREGEGKPDWPIMPVFQDDRRGFPVLRCPDWRSPGRPCARSTLQTASGARNRLGALEGKIRQRDRRQPRAVAFEQLPPLKSARAHQRKPCEHPIATTEIVGGHQAERFGQGWIGTRLAECLLEEQ